MHLVVVESLVKRELCIQWIPSVPFDATWEPLRRECHRSRIFIGLATRSPSRRAFTEQRCPVLLQPDQLFRTFLHVARRALLAATRGEDSMSLKNGIVSTALLVIGSPYAHLTLISRD